MTDFLFVRVGEPVLDPAVVEALQYFDPRADFKWIPGANIWEAGWWWDPSEIQRKGAELALGHHLARPSRHHSPGRIMSLQAIIAGWRPAFAIPPGRNPETGDVEEMRRRDWHYRHSFESMVADLEDHAMGGEEEEKSEAIRRVAHELSNDAVLYGILTSGRKSLVVPGLRPT